MLARQRALEEVGGLSRQQREEAELTALIRSEELAAAKSRVRAASAELGAARAAIPQPPDHGSETGVVVRAPSDGRVLLVLEESERVVTAGTTLLELGRDSDLEIVADVLSEDAVRIPPDAPVDLVGWGGDVLLHGTVRRIEPAARTRVSALGVEEQRVNVIITPTKAPRALGDGFRLDAHITIWEGRDVLVALASAVYTVGDESRVFVVENGRARERTIRVGHRSDAGVEILEGLTAGEVVVLFPSDRVRSGVRLRYIEPTTAVSARGP
jgi:HlyD family secretion protein